jgi:uncharacterized protein
MHGQFAWYDLFTPDPSAAKKFYPSVTGWGTQLWKGDYTMWMAGNAMIGGISPISAEQRAQGVPPHWLAYVSVDDVDSAANRVRSLGGKVMHGPENIPDVGRFAIIEDPQGAMLAIFKSNNPSPGFDGTPAVGKMTWHELMTTDYRAAFDFYRQLFGWENTGEMDMGPGGKYLMYGKNGKMYGGIYNREGATANVPPNWLFYANVKDINKSVEAAKKNGGQLRTGPMEVPGGSVVAVLTDPQGARFALHQTTAPAASAASGAKATAKKRSTTKPKAKAAAGKKSKPRTKAAARKKSKSKAKSRTKARPKKAARKTRRR